MVAAAIWRPLLLAAALLWSGGVWAWGAAGHRALAEAGYGKLTPKQQQSLAPLIAAAPMVPKRLAGKPAAALADLAVWPDRVRDLKVTTLFERYGAGRVPAALRPWQLRTTASWHYENARFVDAAGRPVKGGGGCQPRPSGDLAEAFEALKRAFGQVESARDQALILAFLLHLGGDAYQPLHRMAQVDERCRHDKGGNGFCAVEGRGTRCERNLHQIWDAGFGIFEQPVEVARPPRRLDLSAALEFDSAAVYPRRLPLSAAYEKRARVVVSEAAARGAGFNHLLLERVSACLARGRRCTTL